MEIPGGAGLTTAGASLRNAWEFEDADALVVLGFPPTTNLQINDQV